MGMIKDVVEVVCQVIGDVDGGMGNVVQGQIQCYVWGRCMYVWGSQLQCFVVDVEFLVVVGQCQVGIVQCVGDLDVIVCMGSIVVQCL